MNQAGILILWPALCFAVAPFAVAGCASELTATAGMNQLPPDCRGMGPLHLGMTYAQVARLLGRPDTYFTSDKPHYTAAVYVFPRDLTQRLRKHPVQNSFIFFRHAGVIIVTMRSGRVVGLTSKTDAVPSPISYRVGGIAIGDQISTVLPGKRNEYIIGRWKTWISFKHYPIILYEHVGTGRIKGIGIAGGNEPTDFIGNALAWTFKKNPSTGKIIGFRVFVHH